MRKAATLFINAYPGKEPQRSHSALGFACAGQVKPFILASESLLVRRASPFPAHRDKAPERILESRSPPNANNRNTVPALQHCLISAGLAKNKDSKLYSFFAKCAFLSLGFLRQLKCRKALMVRSAFHSRFDQTRPAAHSVDFHCELHARHKAIHVYDLGYRTCGHSARMHTNCYSRKDSRQHPKYKS